MCMVTITLDVMFSKHRDYGIYIENAWSEIIYSLHYKIGLLDISETFKIFIAFDLKHSSF